MKVGCQTICWGPRITDVEGVLADIAAAGFAGVEIAQAPARLRMKTDKGPRPIKIVELLRLLNKYHLQLIGLAGGSLRERIDFCEDYRPEYLYVEDYDAVVGPVAENAGFTLAVHPHLFKPIYRLGHAEKLLHEHPGLQFILDTAHLTIAGDSLTDAFNVSRGRVASVHLKDWSPDYGRHSHRYAKGFTELGRGIIDLDPIIERLRRVEYKGWVLWEQDCTRTEPIRSAVASARWLVDRKILQEIPKLRETPRPAENRVTQPEAVSSFLRAVMEAGTKGVDLCYERIAQAFFRLLPCNLVTIWRCTASQELVSMLASSPPVEVSERTRRHDQMLTGTAITAQKVMHYDLEDPANREKYSHPEILNRFQPTHLVSIPILNPWNLNHVVMLVNLFTTSPDVGMTDEELLRLGEDVALAADSAVEDRCSSAAGHVNYLAKDCRGSERLLESFRDLVQQFLGCEGVAIFIVDETGTRLELEETTGTKWHVPEPEQFYRPGQGLTGTVWMTGEPLLCADFSKAPDLKLRSEEEAASPERSCLVFPLLSAPGEVRGVVRCRNRRARAAPGKSMAFSDDDIAVLDALCQAMLPHFLMLSAQERRGRAVGRMTHELKVPVVVIRGAAEAMMKTRGVKDFFDYDYPGDVWSWSDVMRRILENAHMLQYLDKPLTTYRTPTFLLKDVVAAAAKQVRLPLEERGFSEDRITYGNFDQIPLLEIDRGQFQQVIFNLLSNAIKHCFDDPTKFEVRIDGIRRGDEYVLRFRDKGPGIPKGMETAIFDEGVRGPLAIKHDVRGEGLGLWVVRRIVQAHDGRVEVTSRKDPTEISVFLPKTLAYRDF